MFQSIVIASKRFGKFQLWHGFGYCFLSFFQGAGSWLPGTTERQLGASASNLPQPQGEHSATCIAVQEDNATLLPDLQFFSVYSLSFSGFPASPVNTVWRHLVFHTAKNVPFSAQVRKCHCGFCHILSYLESLERSPDHSLTSDTPPSFMPLQT